MAWASITFLGSTLTRSSLAAAGLGIVAFIVVGILSVRADDRPVPADRARRAGAGARPRHRRAGRRSGRPSRRSILIGAAGVVAWLAFRRQEL